MRPDYARKGQEMITLLLLACQVELEQVDLHSADKSYLIKSQRARNADDLWLEQCVAKKEAGL